MPRRCGRRANGTLRRQPRSTGGRLICPVAVKRPRVVVDEPQANLEEAKTVTVCAHGDDAIEHFVEELVDRRASDALEATEAALDVEVGAVEVDDRKCRDDDGEAEDRQSDDDGDNDSQDSARRRRARSGRRT